MIKDVPSIGDNSCPRQVKRKTKESPLYHKRKQENHKKKQKARKGTNVNKSAQEDSETNKEESVEAMNSTPLTTKSDSVVNWKIFQQGQRSIYQIMRANRADTVYMSFGAMIKDFTREDRIELYRLVMQKYETNRPEDAYDIVMASQMVQAVGRVKQIGAQVEQGLTGSSAVERHADPAAADYDDRDEFLRWVEAEMVSPEVESEKWRRLLQHWMYGAFDVSTDDREEDFFPQNGM
ncbi:hypothetical protein Tco_0968217 [Tanacetum coccineum]